jgi:hypothetical protein
MSEFVLDGYEELRPLVEVIEDFRSRAGEMLGRVATHMGFGETAIVYSTQEGSESDEDRTVAEMGKDKNPEIEVKDEQRTKPDGTEVTVHTESLKAGSTGPRAEGGTSAKPKGK